jgi:cell division protein ZapA
MSAEGNPRRTITLDITILGREFKVACKESERAELTEAVALLDKRMREIRDAGKVTGTDRIAVMTALNFAHELLRERRAAAPAAAPSASAIDGDSARRRIESMQTAIDQALAGQEKLF